MKHLEIIKEFFDEKFEITKLTAEELFQVAQIKYSDDFEKIKNQIDEKHRVFIKQKYSGEIKVQDTERKEAISSVKDDSVNEEDSGSSVDSASNCDQSVGSFSNEDMHSDCSMRIEIDESSNEDIEKGYEVSENEAWENASYSDDSLLNGPAIEALRFLERKF